ncbi:MAG: hypothetical protein NT067_04810 [Candidatus Diapherotrites archaeon]|nr:hypothetical protein [Candidatus Diapherotrites archaeon]
MKLPKARVLQPMPGSVFCIQKPKKVSRKQVRRFWADYDAGRRVRKNLRKPIRWKRTLLPFSKSMAGTAREFQSQQDFENALKLAESIPRYIMGKKPKYFELQPVEILGIDRKGLRYVERVYPALLLWIFSTRLAAILPR